MSNVNKQMDIYLDQRGQSIVIEIEEYRNGYYDIKRRHGKIRVITEITNENLRYCKDLMKIVDEFRHLDRIKGGNCTKRKGIYGNYYFRGSITTGTGYL